MNLQLPQVVWLCLVAASLTQALIQHGKPQQPHSFGRAIVAAILGGALLYWGGFFGGAQ